MSGRDASGTVLNAIAPHVPWLVGGAADLAPSTKTRLTFAAAGDFGADEPTGRNLHFGVREHAMSAVLNGLSLSKLRPYGAGFLIFSDYARPAIRLSALMEITCDDAVDLPVPGQKYTFGIVKAAQARGDFEVLASRGRRLLRVHLGADVAAGLDRLKTLVNEALA